MPRPGPRPYECVRRAWHSERHQSIRGSIIQQIFRVVTEAHSSATKKNREWKEKLPIVVLRAEEIMYSKANSEAEYMNFDTLWDRVNDAVDTIIRRDEGSETGDLLPPCVEAALNLGCVPVRASRSQRHNNPRSYLTPRGHDPPPPTISTNVPSNDCNLQSLPPAQTSSHPNYPRAEAAPYSYQALYDNAWGKHNPLQTGEVDNRVPNFGSVYPLYYGNRYPAERSHVGVAVPENPSYDTILVGTPVGTSYPERPMVGSTPSLLPCDNSLNIINTAEPRDARRKRACDLSLRLGPSSAQCDSAGKSSGEAGSSNSLEFCFFPGESYYHHSMFK
ncbi:hypothetical protein SAY86_026425 [Trapa natans]|uniref:Histone acetyltransferase n=1 Tax=Trapa natans TaxID=22666 RepID=A0AAN7QHP2_TRANT|nr:hypothetical protein SAY86_026425 [Trapa natans]